MTTITETALSLACAGLPVFPCNSEKRPMVVNWPNKASTDPGAIRTMFGVASAAMIGVPMGAASGIFALDIDFKNGAADWHEARHSDLPATRTHRTMNGGLHYLFKSEAHGVRNSTGKLAQGVDVRGDGGYIIFPPSAGYSVECDAAIAEAPEWLVEAALAANSKTAPAPAQPVQATPPRVSGVRPWHSMSGLAKATQLRTQPPSNEGTPYGRAALESACQEIRAAIDGAKHEVINRAAYSIGGLVSAGEILERDAFADLSAALGEILHRCKDRKAAQNTLRRAFDEGRGKARSVPDMPLAPPIEVHPAAAFLAKFPEAIQRAASSKPLPVADKLMDVPGALGMFVDYCNATAISPQPFLALAAGITAIGALAGRQYRTHTDARTNIYTVGVADSGGGKGHARSMVKRVFAKAGLSQYLAGDDVASGTAIYTALTRHPSLVAQIDEFGDWLKDILSEKAAPHRKQINQRLKTLYSEAAGVVGGTEYADQTKMGKPREDIIQPNFCVHGTTTPGQFWRAIGSSSLEDGLMARFLIFISPESYPDEQEPALIPIPSGLIEAFQAIAAGPDNRTGNLAAVMASTIEPEPYTAPMTPAAQEAYRAMRAAQLAKQRNNEGSYITSIAGRMAENAIKLSLVRSISRDARRPVIDETDIAWGRALAEHCIDTILREAADNVADTQHGLTVAKALQIIRARGPITAAEMGAKLGIPKRDRDGIIIELVEREAIKGIPQGGGRGAGVPTVRYIAV